MSNIIATVSKIQNCDSLNIVNFDFNGTPLSMMSLELNEKIQIGTKVKLNCKSSHIAIAKNFSGEVSYSNKLDCVIQSLDNGELLCCLHLKIFDTVLESIITVNSSHKMNLQVGDNVTAFIKASELSIAEVIND